jgi:hypothetical protein
MQLCTYKGQIRPVCFDCGAYETDDLSSTFIMTGN